MGERMNATTEKLAAALRAALPYVGTMSDPSIRANMETALAEYGAAQRAKPEPAGEHMAEPWHVDDGGDGEIMIWGGTGAVDVPDIGEIYNNADARRIVACVNACAGIPTETLEAKLANIAARLNFTP